MARIDPTTIAAERSGEAYISPVRIAVTADGTLVTDDDPEAVAILVGAGGSLPWPVAERYGLVVGQRADGAERRVRGKRRDDIIEGSA